jgi:hypothetical protein
MQADHMQASYQIFEHRLVLSAEQWLKYLTEAFENKSFNFVNSLLHLIDLDRIRLLFKDRSEQFDKWRAIEDSLWVDLLKSGQSKFIESLIFNMEIYLPE